MNRPGAPSPSHGGFASAEEWLGVANHFGLSLRELACCVLNCQGLSKKKMARQLGCQLNTAAQHCARVYQKTKVHSKVELLLRVLEYLRTQRQA